MIIQTVAFVLASAVLAGAAEPVQKPLEVREIQTLAQQAKRGVEHAAVASHWEARARAFDAQAAKYERDADALARRGGHDAMRYKWPALAQAPVDWLRAKAMQARRAANESRGLMAHHREVAKTLAAAE